ncbi:hypothetical protein BGW36DRAFT_360174 [Talaromyces proteolyticus]|uniref:Queuosine 5'-phosphate N-glycosylase/hydrolase n=1 Tax=Talaromyces proteolyticus TaxID=1131652 RepID=A0AAD4KT11_9EURO|nr:uncharacterized protein BGW36DRAFT_360174 [Talaromyces proteolyticus]KAH8696330.1 hypothetical protein BGW36DRAFT_360174 [Talaromyces proteolyticus]
MSDDEADPELLELLRQSLGLGKKNGPPPAPETKVLQNARFIFDNAIDVALDPRSTKAAARTIWQQMQEKHYSTKSWSAHELHPKSKDEGTVDFILTMDLLNFSFWSDETDESKRFAIEYRGQKWTGYWSLVAALQRALDEDIPITSPDFWLDEDALTEDVLRHVFRSATDEQIPLFEERLECLREAGRVLDEKFDGSFINCIYDANQSAAALVNLLAENFACFRDEALFDGRKVRFYKRAQILVADLWASFEGESFGEFHDIENITMFADYRIPQILNQLGCLLYSPPLESQIRRLQPIEGGSTREIEIRGASIWCVELIRQEINRLHSESQTATNSSRHSLDIDRNGQQISNLEAKTAAMTISDGKTQDENENGNGNSRVNAILIDFFLYDTMKELERDGRETIPHHRTRSIWY